MAAVSLEFCGFLELDGVGLSDKKICICEHVKTFGPDNVRKLE